jgi:hypothetical protein
MPPRFSCLGGGMARVPVPHVFIFGEASRRRRTRRVRSGLTSYGRADPRNSLIRAASAAGRSNMT